MLICRMWVGGIIVLAIWLVGALAAESIAFGTFAGEDGSISAIDAENASLAYDAGGAFDALVQAIVGLGAGSSWAQLPPVTAPASLARAPGQGVLHGRLPRGANGMHAVEASPQPAEQMQHDGQRGVAELGTILWHAMGAAHDAPELAP